MHPHLFGIVKTFGLLLALSFVIGFWLSVRRGRRRGFDPNLVLDFCLTVMISSLIGVRLFYVATHAGEFEPWYEVFFIWKGGLTLYGGIILAILAVWFFCRRRRIAFLPLADVLAPQVALGIGITRLGCFLNGCCYGRPTDGPLGISFPETCAAGWETGCAALHPTQLYSSAAGFAVFALLILWERRSSFPGATFARFLSLYGLTRFLVDLFRHYDPGDMGPLGITTSQWISVVLFGAGCWLMLTRRSAGESE
ncbi:prolipoprotein diacylglyceryl transferase [bacterium]|nr:prolipoprotein diacylglyceryl transferase [bacterium]MBU1675007.1 prolipoprotein diacylglyceryl transferase [bacterium]